MVNVTVNCKRVSTDKKKISDILRDYFDELENEDISIIVNGHAIEEAEREIKENDEIFFLKKGEIPKKEYLERMMYARITKENYLRLKESKVMILGLGGLGSNIAISLARSSVNKLILVDYDIVDITNLNRQHYYLKDVGGKKTAALKRQIEEINPFIDVEILDLKVDEENIKSLVLRCQREDIILCEAFDKAHLKEMVFNEVLLSDGVKLVMGSGMAGYFSSNEIKTRRILKRIYISGDEKNEINENLSLMSPRVTLCAMHQANMIIRLILGEEEV